MKKEDYILIMMVKNHVEKKPELFKNFLMAILDGIEESARKDRERACDMETLASVAISMAGKDRVSQKVKKEFEQLAISKLQKYDFKTQCRWDWAVNKKEDL